MPSELLNPQNGLLVGLLLAVAALWREHQRADQDDRDQRDRALALSEAQVAATNRVADGQEVLASAFRDYIREQAARHRTGDR